MRPILSWARFFRSSFSGSFLPGTSMSRSFWSPWGNSSRATMGSKTKKRPRWWQPSPLRIPHRIPLRFKGGVIDALDAIANLVIADIRDDALLMVEIKERKGPGLIANSKFAVDFGHRFFFFGGHGLDFAPFVNLFLKGDEFFENRGQSVPPFFALLGEGFHRAIEGLNLFFRGLFACHANRIITKIGESAS